MIAALNTYNFTAAYQNGVSWARKQLPIIAAVAQRHISYAFNTGKSFVLTNRAYLIAAGCAAFALLIFDYIRKRIPQYPDVQMESSLNLARLQIKIPKAKRAAPNVSLTFCIDVSQSMDPDERIGAVKRALTRVLESAKKVVGQQKGAKINFAVCIFNDKASTTTPVTSISSSTNVQQQVDGLKCNGSTSIIAGLTQAAELLKQQAKTNGQAAHTVVLLSDGEDSIDQSKLTPIQKIFSSHSARLFAIGIGAAHKKATLQSIAAKGTYIDTTAGQTIEGAIAAIYEQAIATFQELKLSTTGLAAGSWSAGRVRSVALKEGGSYCDLGSLSEEQSQDLTVGIDVNAVKETFDLSTLSFSLTFRDPQGRQGRIHLPWNPNTLIIPRVVSSARH